MEKKPGWDAKAIALIAREHYGTYAKMFEEHDWPETGSGLMRSVQTRVVEKYGSVENFLRKHPVDFGSAENSPHHSNQASHGKPGWDAKAISRIAKEYFGSFTGMFEAHGWEERGTYMMTSVQRHVAEDYESIANFLNQYPVDIK